MIYKLIKRIFDIIVSFISIVVLSPLLLILMILTKLTSKGKIFFLHKRIGKNGKEFNVIKFRTMKEDNRPLSKILTKEQYEEYLKNYKLKDDPRITKFGKFMRKSSFDELPQLFNIFVGTMSFVGPRPVMAVELDKISNEDKKKYLSVTPGLTGFWASHGRSTTTYYKRMQLEIFYVEHASLWLDFKILVKTFFVFFKDSE